MLEVCLFLFVIQAVDEILKRGRMDKRNSMKQARRIFRRRACL